MADKADIEALYIFLYYKVVKKLYKIVVKEIGLGGCEGANPRCSRSHHFFLYACVACGFELILVGLLPKDSQDSLIVLHMNINKIGRHCCINFRTHFVCRFYGRWLSRVGYVTVR